MGTSHYCPVSCFKNSTARNACCDYLDEGFTGNTDRANMGGITSMSDCMDYCNGAEFFGWQVIKNSEIISMLKLPI